MLQKYIKKHLPEFVYGGIDGTITTFAIVAGSIGANLGMNVALLLGFANVFADGFSMASSSYLAERSDGNSFKNAISAAFATFASFITLGSLPLLALVSYALGITTANVSLNGSLIIASFVFIFVGYIKASVNNKHKLISIIETLAIGLIAASIAYSVGQFASGLM